MTRLVVFAVLVIASTLPLSVAAKDDLRVQNVHAFSRIYGYVRFFHPSDEAAQVDWARFAVHGVTTVLDAQDSDDLRARLETLFLPVAPTIEISVIPISEPKPLPGTGRNDALRAVAWQHFGVRLSERSGVYQSARVNRETNVQPLFDHVPGIGEATETEILDGLYVRVPLTLYASDAGIVGGNSDAFGVLQTELKAIDLDNMTADELSIRLANTVITWNVFQHFYPYFDVVNVDWLEVLDQTLTSALDDISADAYFETLSRMVAQLQDGHGVVRYHFDSPRGRPAIRLEVIEKRVVVTAAPTIESLMPGDVLVAIDGRSAAEEFDNRRALISGSPQLSEYRALNLFGVGPRDQPAQLEIDREGMLISVSAPRSAPPNPYFNMPEFDYPAVRKLNEGFYYVSLRKLDRTIYDQYADRLANANAIILDYRWGGGSGKFTMFDILPHLTREDLHYAAAHVPQIVYPDRREMRFGRYETPMLPKAPYWKARMAIITSPVVVSSGETIMGMVDHFDVAEIVGRSTAGCNGNSNYIDLPGGFGVTWTGLKILKHDDSQFHLIGIQPDYPVERSIKAVREGRDEMLDKAIDILSNRFSRG